MELELTEEDFYWSAERYRIFTEQYHLKRGYCCQNGCKHCPYGYDASAHRIVKKTKDTAKKEENNDV